MQDKLKEAQESFAYSQMSDEKKLQTLMERRKTLISEEQRIIEEIVAKSDAGDLSEEDRQTRRIKLLELANKLLETEKGISNLKPKAQNKQYADAVVTGSVEARSMGMKAYSQTKELTLLERIAKATESANKQPPLLTLGFY
jgi:hypothetical protein